MLNSIQRSAKRGSLLSYNPTDLYQTPYCLTQLLLQKVFFQGTVLEPAAGHGAITKVLNDFGMNYFSSDLNFGDNRKDFLSDHFDIVDNIIGNPPFKFAHQFILKAKTLAQHKIAFLLPFSYLSGKKRYQEIWQDTQFPLSQVLIFPRYLDLSKPIREDGKIFAGGMVNFAWFVWDKNCMENYPIIKFLDIEPYLAISDKWKRKDK